MTLSIALRMQLFSHRPGTCAPMPLSNLYCQWFPTRLKIFPISQNASTPPSPLVELALEQSGPSKDFTVTLDLEHPSVCMHQQSPSGFQHLRLHVDAEKGLVLTALRGQVTLHFKGLPKTLLHKETFPLLPPEAFVSTPLPAHFERLSLGSHKKQEIVPFSVKRDLFTQLPFLMRLGALMPASAPILYSGSASLLALTFTEETLDTLLRVCFFDLFVPQLTDGEHQGDLLPAPLPQEDPICLLSETSSKLRQLLFKMDGSTLHLLPHLPPSFHAGRFLNIDCGSLGVLNFSWTKRCMREMHFIAHQTGSMRLALPKEIRRFRLREGGTCKRVWHDAAAEIFFCLGQNLFFDRFEH